MSHINKTLKLEVVIKEAIKNLESCFNKNTIAFEQKNLQLKAYLNETWFSDMLAWLLNPKASHGYNTIFAQELLSTIAKVRKNGKDKYAHCNHFLKTGKKTGLNNSTVIREFFLSGELGKKPKDKRGARYCDIVVLDLDYKDSFMLVIENKLFSANHPFQLQEYQYAVDQKYSEIKTRDYVYLTINGADPRKYEKKREDRFGDKKHPETTLYKNWVCISWVDHILPIIKKLNEDIKKKQNKKGESIHEIAILEKILGLFKKLKDEAKLNQYVENFRKILIDAFADCLLEKLNEFNDKENSKWELHDEKKSKILIYTKYPKRKLEIHMLPNFTITIQSKFKTKNPLCEKIIIPFGVNPDQALHLISYAAKDIYSYHFNNPVGFIKKGKHVVCKNEQLSDKAQICRKIFEFAYKNVCELKVLMSYSSSCWKAMDEEVKKEYDI